MKQSRIVIGILVLFPAFLFLLGISANKLHAATHDVIFQKRNSIDYSYQQKRVYVFKSVSGITDVNNFTQALNIMSPNTEGEFWFNVSEKGRTKKIGFGRVGEQDVEYGVLIEERGIALISNKSVGGIIQPLDYGDEVRVRAKAGELKVFLKGSEIASVSLNGLGNEELIIAVRLGNNDADFVSLKTNIEPKIKVTSFSISPQTRTSRGGVSLNSTSSSGTVYMANENEEIELSKSRFDTERQKMIDAKRFSFYLSHTDYLSVYSTTRNKLPEGEHNFILVDGSGLKFPLNVTIPDEHLWKAVSGLRIINNEISYTGSNSSDWISSSVCNVLHRGSKGVFSFRKNNSTSLMKVGLRNIQNSALENGSSVSDAGFYFNGNGTFQLYTGSTSLGDFPYRETDDFAMKIDAGVVKFYQNNRIIKEGNVGAQLSFTVDLTMQKTNSSGLSNWLSGFKIEPVVRGVNESIYCGRKSKEITMSKNLVFSGFGIGSTHNWTKEGSSETFPQSLNLANVTPGIYHLNTPYSFNWGGTNIGGNSNRTFVMGHKAEWRDRVNAITPVSNTIKNSNENNYRARGNTFNVIPVGKEGWINFAVGKFKNYNSAYLFYNKPIYMVSIRPYSQIGNYANFPSFGYCDIFLEPTSENGGHLRIVGYDMNNTKKYYSNIISVSHEDNITMMRDASGNMKFLLNGNLQTLNYTNLNGASQGTLSSIPVPSQQAMVCVFDGHSGQFLPNNGFGLHQIGPEDVILSYPCTRLDFVDLKRKVDGNYYYADSDRIGFRYLEEYAPLSGNLEYKILNHKEEDVFANASTPVTPPSINRDYGDNRLHINLGPHRNILPAGFYILEVTNDKREKRYLRFRLD